jgi:hypothetical protein
MDLSNEYPTNRTFVWLGKSSTQTLFAIDCDGEKRYSSTFNVFII